jgi:hypothetical protein
MKWRHSQFVVSPRLALSVLIAAVILMAAPAASLARAFTGKFHDEFPTESGTLTDYPCFDGVPVVMTGTLTRDGHFSDAGRRVSFHGTNVIDYTVEVGDGRHAAGQVVDHFNFTFNFKQTRSVVTSAQQEEATLYSADDEPVGTIIVHVTHHVMWSDLNGNFEVDPEEVTAEVDNSKVTCR